MEVDLHLNKFESPLPKNACANCRLGWNWPIRREEDFKILSVYFRYFVIISLSKRVALRLKKLESPSPKDA